MTIEIKVFNPGMDMDIFAADVYVNGTREFCGRGLPYQQAIREAAHWIENMLVVHRGPLTLVEQM